MSESSERTTLPGDPSHPSKSKRFHAGRILIVFAAFAIVWFVLYLCLPSAQERLAALDKARAIPDQENAALVYARLLSDYKSPFTLADLTLPVSDADANAIRQDPSLLAPDKGVDSNLRYMSHPWRASEFPKVAKSIGVFSRHMNTLVEATTLENCRFLLCRPPETVEKTVYQDLIVEAMINCHGSLTAAAYLDLGEGRMSDAQSKAVVLVRMSRHFYQHYRLRDSMIAESRGLRLLDTLVVMADPSLLDLDALRALTGPLDDQLAASHREIDEVTKLLWQHYADYASDVDMHPDRWSHIRYCIRKGRWGQILRCSDPVLFKSPEAAERHRGGHYLYLLAKHCRHRLLIESRRFKNQSGLWPTRLDQVAAQLPLEVLKGLAETQPMTLCLADDCFVLCIPQSANPDAMERELLIQDGRNLTTSERQFLDSYLQSCFRTLITAYKPERETRWEEDMEDWFLDMARYSVPILLTQLKQADDDTKIGALNLLGKIADREYNYGKSRHVFFLQDLIDRYLLETTLRIKEHYLGILGFFNDVHEEQQTKVVEFLKGVMSQGDSPDLRTAAAMALLRASRTEGLYELLNGGVIEDGHQFGEEGRSYILQSIHYSLFSDHSVPWIWRGYGSDPGYPFGEGAYGYGHGLVKHVPGEKYNDSYIKIINEWWQENKDKLKAVLQNDPNASQLMKELFHFEQ